MASFEIKSKDLAGLGAELRSASERMRAEVDKTVAKVGVKISTEAKAVASQHSKTIPSTIKLRMIPGAAVIEAGNEDTPMAVLYELGNKKAKPTDRTFRHPVFARRDQGRQEWTWVEQVRHPYLRPVLIANRKQITQMMEGAWDDAMRRLEGGRL